MNTADLTPVEPTPDDVQYLEDRIYEFNAGATGVRDGEWLAILVRDESGRIVAGISGNTWMHADRAGDVLVSGAGVLPEARIRGRRHDRRPSTRTHNILMRKRLARDELASVVPGL